jgi:hypothetical protein
LTIAESILPVWFVLPLASLTLVVLGVHLQWMHQADMPGSRRRIRTASNLVSMLTVPLIAAGFALINPNDHRVFVMVWLAIVGLLGVVVVLAGVDMLNNLRIHSKERHQVRSEIRQLQGEMRTLVRERLKGDDLGH